MSFAPLSTNIRMDDPSERKGASDDSVAEEDMKTQKYSEGKWWSRPDDADEADADAAGEAAGAAEAPRALKENLNLVGSEGA